MAFPPAKRILACRWWVEESVRWPCARRRFVTCSLTINKLFLTCDEKCSINGEISCFGMVLVRCLTLRKQKFSLFSPNLEF